MAVPGAAWHRRRDQRLLGAGTLGKPIAVDAMACLPESRGEGHAELSLRVWVGGVITMEIFYNDDQVPDVKFSEEDQDILPFAEALVRLADDQFAFTTAENGGAANMFKRMAAV